MRIRNGIITKAVGRGIFLSIVNSKRKVNFLERKELEL